MKMTITLVSVMTLMLAAAPRAESQINFGFHNKGTGIHVNLGGHRRAPRRHVHNVYCKPFHHEGYWQIRERKVWVEERFEVVTIPAVYETRYGPCGQVIRICVQPERFERRCIPGYWKVVQDKVFVEACTTYSCGH